MIIGRAEFQTVFNVSRETVERLAIYARLLCKWNQAINLVSKSTEQQIWIRHFLDSAQIWNHMPENGTRSVADLGSGAGFPGLVLSILAKQMSPHMTVHLVESDLRKAAFLAEVTRETATKTVIHAERVENVPRLGVDVVVARALAPLPALIGLAEKQVSRDGICLFLKGHKVHSELKEAEKNWQFTSRIHPSMTSSDGVVLQIGEIRRV